MANTVKYNILVNMFKCPFITTMNHRRKIIANEDYIVIGVSEFLQTRLMFVLL
jgi:hypothetical protein